LPSTNIGGARTGTGPSKNLVQELLRQPRHLRKDPQRLCPELVPEQLRPVEVQDRHRPPRHLRPAQVQRDRRARHLPPRLRSLTGRRRVLRPGEAGLGVRDGAGVGGDLRREAVLGRDHDEAQGDKSGDLRGGDHGGGADGKAAGVEDERDRARRREAAGRGGA